MNFKLNNDPFEQKDNIEALKRIKSLGSKNTKVFKA